MASPWCEAVLYSPDPPFLFGGGSGNETSPHPDENGCVREVIIHYSLGHAKYIVSFSPTS